MKFTPLRVLVAVCAGVLIAALPGYPQAPPAVAQQLELAHSADAFGTYAFVGNRVIAGRSAVSGLGCNAQPGAHDDNRVAGLRVPPVFITGVIRTRADALAEGETVSTRTLAETNGANVLEGAITAREVRAVSTTIWTGSEFRFSDAGTRFVGLRVLGNPIDEDVPPNTRVELPGLGHAILNEQRRRQDAKSASFTINMIHVFVTVENPLDVPRGTEIFVSHAKSDLHPRLIGVLDGFAYGSFARVEDGRVLSGRSALVRLGCLGTDGEIKRNSVARVRLPGAFHLGEVVTTAQGIVTEDRAEGETMAEVENVNLLGGLVTARAIKADAHALKVGDEFEFSDRGSHFVDLKVAGFPDIGDDVPPNTRLRISGIGVLWLHRVIENPNFIEVRMIELIVLQDNSFGLPVGTHIQVAVAHASAH